MPSTFVHEMVYLSQSPSPFRWYLSRSAFANLSCTECKHAFDGPTAIALGEIGLATVEGAEKVDEVELAATLGNLGNAYGKMGNANRKRELLERALAIKERMYGPDHAEVAVSLTNLGNAYGDLGDANKMRDLLERALAIHEHTYGSDHSKVASTLVNLGNACGKLGDCGRKREMLMRALGIQERMHGPSHAEVLPEPPATRMEFHCIAKCTKSDGLHRMEVHGRGGMRVNI